MYADELKHAASKVIDSGHYILGSNLIDLEQNLSELTKTKYAIGVGNGFDALKIILRGYIQMGMLREGDEVIVPANTFIATVLSILDAGLKPVLVDPDPDTYNLDLDNIEKHITPGTKAIVVVHLYGKVCWSKKIRSIANKRRLLIIEDCAQALGAFYENTPAGSLGDAAAHSFYPTKILGALGDAGAITTNDRTLCETVVRIGNYGGHLMHKYRYDYKGVNSRLDEIHAAMLNVKIKYLQDECMDRDNIAHEYLHWINNPLITLPQKGSSWHLFVVRAENRDGLKKYLLDCGIETLIHYPIPPHKQSALKEFSGLYLPITERLSNEALSLPIYPYMSRYNVQFIINAINQWKG